MVRITEFRSENVKRIKVVSVTPDGNLVIVAGDNEQGKSSLLDGIEYLFKDARSLPSDPVRHGAEFARVSAKLDNGLVATRVIKPDGSNQLVVKNADGNKLSSPQSILDKMIGSIAFDPYAFSQMKARDQAETLRKLLGLDFTELDKSRGELYDMRTDVGREIKRITGVLDSQESFPDAPKELVVITELTQQHQSAIAHNRELLTLNENVADRRSEYKATVDLIKDREATIKALQQSNERSQEYLNTTQEKIVSLVAEISGFELADAGAIMDAIGAAEATNTQIRENNIADDLNDSLEGGLEARKKLTEKIDAIDGEKRALLERANMPINGLAFDESGVTFKGVPLDQASSAQKLKVSIAMGMAMNPTLRVQIIREAAMLDKKSMAIIAEMADKHDFQIWLERVGQDDQATVIIEDGQIQGEIL